MRRLAVLTAAAALVAAAPAAAAPARTATLGNASTKPFEWTFGPGTGVLLAAYVIVHALGNLKALQGAGDGGVAALDEYATFLREAGDPVVPEEGLLWIFRTVLLSAFVIHVVGVTQLTTWSGATAPLTPVVLVLLALAGFALGQRDLGARWRTRRGGGWWGWVAGLAAYLAAAAPVILAGIMGRVDTGEERAGERSARVAGVLAAAAGIVAVAMFVTARGIDHATGGPAMLSFALRSVATFSKPASLSVDSASASDWFSTFGTSTAPGPEET